MIDTYSIKKDLSILNAKWLFNLISKDNSDDCLYTFIGRSYPWAVDSEPPMPVDDTYDYIQTWKDMISLKRVNYSDLTLAIKKNVWSPGVIYDMYDDKDPNIDEANFYILTSKNKVYKCLDNNNRSVSTQEPDSNSLTPWSTSDGYKWQLMCELDEATLTKWSNEKVIPVKELTENDDSIQWQVQEAAIPGTIDCIQVMDGGSNYIQGQNINVTIIGDGQGASATAILNGDKIERIRIDNRGSGYTYANITITGNAQLRAIISPIKGHGSNIVEELFGRYIIVRSVFDKDENNTFPTDLSFRQIGLVLNPTLYGTNNKAEDTEGILQLGSIKIEAGTDNFIYNETILNQTNNSTATLSSKSGNILRLTDINGKFNVGDSIIGVSSGITSVISESNTPYLNLYSGSLLYNENRSPVQRLDSQTETYKIIIAF